MLKPTRPANDGIENVYNANETKIAQYKNLLTLRVANLVLNTESFLFICIFFVFPYHKNYGVEE